MRRFRGLKTAGHAVKRTTHYRRLEDTHTKLEGDETGMLVKGDKIIVFRSRKAYTGAYLVRDSDSHRPHLYRVQKLTPTGKLSTAKKAKLRMWLDDYNTEVFLVKGQESLNLLNSALEDSTKPRLGSHKTTTDYQRQKTYDAENSVRRVLSDNPKFKTLEEVNRYVQLLMDRYSQKPWSSTRLRHAFATLNKRRRGAVAFTWRGRIEMGDEDFCFQKMVVIHEVCHILNTEGVAHGPEFCGTYLKVLEEEMPNAAKLLKDKYDRRNIDYKKF